MKINRIIGGTVLPISNFIMREKIADDFKPEYEPYENGFFLGVENMEEFLNEHVDKHIAKSYIIFKELEKVRKEYLFEKMIDDINEEQFLNSPKYRQKIKNKIFDKKIEKLLSLKEVQND